MIKITWKQFFIILIIMVPIETLLLILFFNYGLLYIKAEIYTSDPLVQEIVNKCTNSEEQVNCVFESFPFSWEDRSLREPLILSPEEIKKRGYKALCRDIATVRKSILDSLGIENELVFTPDHVYVVAYEKGKTYELNNAFLYSYPKNSGRLEINLE